MGGRRFPVAAIARTAGYAAVAVAIGATALQFRQDSTGRSAPLHAPSIESDPLAPALAHCQVIGMAAQDDPACQAAWAENRRRFFTYRPADGIASAAPTERKPAVKSEGR